MPEPSVESGLADETRQLMETANQLSRSFSDLRGAVERRLIDDSIRDDTITRLHDELQEHRRGLSDQLVMPLIRDIITLHDHLGGMVQAARAKEPPDGQSGSEPDNELARTLDGFLIEVEDILARQGVIPFLALAEVFDGARQRAISITPPPRAELAHGVCERVRKGFERNGVVVRPEMVKVYGSAVEPDQQEARDGNG